MESLRQPRKRSREPFTAPFSAKPLHHTTMSNTTTTAAEWTPKQYTIDSGWDFSCIESTAERGVSEADVEVLTKEQQIALLDYCRARVAAYARPAASTPDLFRTKFHKDGTITFWNVYEQQWNRTKASRISDQNLASMSSRDRERLARTAAFQP